MMSQHDDNVLSLDSALIEHTRYAALRARDRLNGPLTPANLHVFLTDPQCLRYPTTIVFDRAGLKTHQFAQSFMADKHDGRKCYLHVDPRLRDRPELLYLVVAYMAAVIDYGDTATADIAELHGSILTDVPQEEFCRKLCEIADYRALCTE